MIRISQFGEITRYDLSRSILGHGVYWTTAYHIDGLLIDTGCSFTAAELHAILAEKKILQIINTHSHEDHIGGNLKIQNSNQNIQTFAHPAAVPVIKNPKKHQPLHLYRRIIWGMPSPARANPLDDGEFIKSDRFRFLVMYTPGHTEDHLCLYEPEQQWIFTGDLFVGGWERTARAGTDIWKIIKSLKMISQLPLKAMYPSAARVRIEPDVILQEKISYLEATGNEVLALADQGLSESEISREVLGGPIWIEFITMGHLSRINLVRSYLRFERD